VVYKNRNHGTFEDQPVNAVADNARWTTFHHE